MSETPENRLRRLRMRSWRRGTREMDLILGPFADKALAALSGADLDAYETLLSENDQDLYLWVSMPDTAPAGYVPIIARIRAEAGFRQR